MRVRKPLVVGLAVLGLVGLSVVLAQQPARTPEADAPGGLREPIRPLPADVLGVRILLGVGDEKPASWSGKVALDQGEVVGLEPWRLRSTGEIKGRDSWEAEGLRTFRPKAQLKKKQANVDAALPAGVIAWLKAPADATLTITTDQGEARVGLADLASGARRELLGGRVEAQLIPAHAALATSDGQEDYPSAASDGKAGAWVAYLEHRPRGPDDMPVVREEPKTFKDDYVPEGGGDQVRLLHFDGNRVVRRFDATGPGLDAWRPAVAVGGDGKVIVAWSENRDGNWDLYARTFDPESGPSGEANRLTTDPGTDTDVTLATAPDGQVWMAWQAWRDGQADIHLAPLAEPGRAANLSDHPANDWSPSLAIDPSGRPLVAFDTYRNGNFDVMLARGGGSASRPIAVADSPRFEVRPSLAVDRSGRAWIGYEERTVNWGKDFGVHDNQVGTPLYRESVVRVRCVDGDRVLDGGDPTAQLSGPDGRMNAFARLTVDRSGRPWLLYRHREENNWRDGATVTYGAIWLGYATTLVGREWTTPRPLPRSDGLLDIRPSLACPPDGPVLAVYTTDGRLHNEIERAGGQRRNHAGPPPGVNNDLFVAALVHPGASTAPEPGGPPEVEPAVAPPHPDEAADVARMRAYRLKAVGKDYQLLRGEFHRHTEISGDGGGDGALEDMWRYALDAGRLDWIGCGDHDNGGGKEYSWWVTQKTTDLYHNAPAFNPMFTYERSVVYPGGHRNVMFPTRGIRTLPRLMGDNGVQSDVNGRDLDVQMLYKYLRELGGICAAHTTATNMGTDWRENDPEVEPFVEIYQGDRDSYEYLGAPRAAHNEGDAAGGWRPLGMVWNALAMQYRLGFQSSSDHISTHISFAVALAESPTREAIFNAFKKRHCYGATDNIVLDVRSGDHLMGDEFQASGPITIQVHARGTAPIARVDIIKDFHHAYSTEPGTEQVDFRWTDEDAVNRNPSWYYVRLIQADGELAWASPIWVHPAGRGR